jgi:hypothetical protein
VPGVEKTLIDLCKDKSLLVQAHAAAALRELCALGAPELRDRVFGAGGLKALTAITKAADSPDTLAKQGVNKLIPCAPLPPPPPRIRLAVQLIPSAKRVPQRKQSRLYKPPRSPGTPPACACSAARRRPAQRRRRRHRRASSSEPHRPPTPRSGAQRPRV